MKIVVCVKYCRGEINPFDESALECALETGGDVTVISMGPDSVKESLSSLTRLGCSRAVLLSDSRFAGSDTLATSYTLSLAIKKINPDIVICGRQSVDGDTGQIGPELSYLLGCSLITNVMKFGTDECETRDGKKKVCLPAVITVERIKKLRFPSIRSRVTEAEVWTSDDLGGDYKRYGLSGSSTRVIKTFKNSKDIRKCRFIDKSELFDIIKKELKTEHGKAAEYKSDIKLKNVWAVGDEAYKAAALISDDVILKEIEDPVKIAAEAAEKKPDVILWCADTWGRAAAPVAAAALKTGLCADCTELETDGKEMFVYRPAGGGEIYAKIKCLTKPAMATVRPDGKNIDFIIAGGKGVCGKFSELRKFAEKMGADIGASRGIVDSGEAPYSMQIGLTGKNVHAKVYLSVGISGAVQHMCAVSSCDTIIAVNPDRDAPVFNYADYGVLCKFEDLVDL